MSKKPYRLLASLLLMLVATLTSCEKVSIDGTTGKSRRDPDSSRRCFSAKHRRHSIDSAAPTLKNLGFR